MKTKLFGVLLMGLAGQLAFAGISANPGNLAKITDVIWYRYVNGQSQVLLTTKMDPNCKMLLVNGNSDSATMWVGDGSWYNSYTGFCVGAELLNSPKASEWGTLYLSNNGGLSFTRNDFGAGYIGNQSRRGRVHVDNTNQPVGWLEMGVGGDGELRIYNRGVVTRWPNYSCYLGWSWWTKMLGSGRIYVSGPGSAFIDRDTYAMYLGDEKGGGWGEINVSGGASACNYNQGGCWIRSGAVTIDGQGSHYEASGFALEGWGSASNLQISDRASASIRWLQAAGNAQANVQGASVLRAGIIILGYERNTTRMKVTGNSVFSGRTTDEGYLIVGGETAGSAGGVAELTVDTSLVRMPTIALSGGRARGTMTVSNSLLETSNITRGTGPSATVSAGNSHIYFTGSDDNSLVAGFASGEFTVASSQYLHLHDRSCRTKLAGVLSGPGKIIKSGVGTMTMTAGNNRHAGDFVVMQGRLEAAVSEVMSPSATYWIYPGSELKVTANQTVGALRNNAVVRLAAGSVYPRLKINGEVNTAAARTFAVSPSNTAGVWTYNPVYGFCTFTGAGWISAASRKIASAEPVPGKMNTNTNVIPDAQFTLPDGEIQVDVNTGAGKAACIEIAGTAKGRLRLVLNNLDPDKRPPSSPLLVVVVSGKLENDFSVEAVEPARPLFPVDFPQTLEEYTEYRAPWNTAANYSSLYPTLKNNAAQSAQADYRRLMDGLVVNEAKLKRGDDPAVAPFLTGVSAAERVRRWYLTPLGKTRLRADFNVGPES